MRTPKEYQEALGELEGLEIYDDDCDGNVCYESHSKIEDLCSFELLQELVDRATPMKPIYISDIKGLIGHYECPNCGHPLYFWQGDNEPSRVHKCCDDCRQAIDWSNE